MVDFALTALASPATDALLSRCVTEDDRRDAARRTATAAHARTLAARALARYLVQARTGLDARVWRFVLDETGKPRILLPSGLDGPAISLSHSGQFVAAAVAGTGPLGIDIEVRRPARRVLALADMAFGECERAEVEAQGHTAFYRIWTLREAFAKATGQGLARATDRSDLVARSPEWGAWTAMVDGTVWRFAHLEPRDGLSLAIAAGPSRDDCARGWSAASIRDLSGMLPGCGSVSF